MHKKLRVLLLTFVDIFRENIGYHSASLTYQFLTLMGSILIFLGFLSLYMPFLEPAKVYEHLRNSLPYYADTVIAKLLPLYEKKAVGSAFSLLLAYYFSVSFAKSINTAFGYVYRRKPIEGEAFFWTLIPLLLLIYAMVLSFAVTLLTLSKSLLGSLYQRLAEFLNISLVLLIISMVYASYFRIRKTVFASSILVALMVFMLNKLFSLLLVKLVSASPLYSLFGTPLLFLVWLYYSFFCLLLGVCFLRRLEEAST
ncbi:MAG: YihY/virulence factor BrkB family protein [Aquificaceae bacterium]|nr:YihY/virulence factor BrkB family protein [Aquificaceae bacterium]